MNLGSRSKFRAPVRPEGSPATVVAALSARKAVRSGILWGYIFGIAIASSEISYVKIYKTAAQRDALAATYGSNKAMSALFGPAPPAPDGGWLHRLQDLHDTHDPRWRVGTPDKHQAAARRGGQRALGSSARRTDHPAWRHGAGDRRPRRRRRGAVGGHRRHHGPRRVSRRVCSISVGPSLYFALAMVATAVMFLAVGAVTSQLAATRRQAASCGAALLGVSYAVRLIADAGVGLHGLIWASPLGWVEELQPLTSPQPLALLPIVAFTAVLAVAAVHLAGNRDVGESIVTDRAHSEAHLGLLFGPTGLAIRLMRAHGHRLVGGDRGVGAPLRSHREICRCHDLGLRRRGVLQARSDRDRCRRGARRVLPHRSGPDRLRRRRSGHGGAVGGVGAACSTTS